MGHGSPKFQRTRLQRAISSLGEGPSRRYSPALREKIRRYAGERLSEGASRAGIAAELGVGSPTLRRVLGEGESGGQLRQVQVVASEKDPSKQAGLVVRGPGGLVVEGLDVAGVVALMKALS